MIFLIESLEMLFGILAFALLLIVTVIAFSRANILFGLWEDTVHSGKIEKIDQKDLLRPWLVRMYQRSYTYRSFGVILLCITATVFSQVLYSYAVDDAQESLILLFSLLKLLTTLATIIALISAVFSTHTLLRKELRQLQRLLPEYRITLEDLVSLHTLDQAFSPQDLFKKK